MFFDPNKGELTNNRVTGFMNAKEFSKHLALVSN
jgi:hypothetical protein